MDSPRILILRTGAMGDILHALPAVAALRRAHPKAVIHWAIEPHWSDLLGSELVDTLIPINTRAWKKQHITLTLREILLLRIRLRAEKYDFCVDLQGSLRSAIIGRLANAIQFAGPESPRERPARLFYRQHIQPTAPHVVEQACEILGKATSLLLTPEPPPLPTDPATEERTRIRIPHTFPQPRPLILLAPTAGWGAKQWPAAHFGQLAARLAQSGYDIAINAAAPQDPTAQTVLTTAAHPRVAVLPATIAELTALLRHSVLFIGGDTGPLHLADALGIPSVALFGPTDPTRNGPWFGMQTSTTRILRDPSSLTDHSRHQSTEAGLGKIDVEAVFNACLELLGKRDHLNHDR